MHFLFIEKIVLAVVTCMAIIAYQSTEDDAKAYIRLFLRMWSVRLIQLLIVIQGVYVTEKFFVGQGPPTRHELGFLFLAIFSTLIWGFFLLRGAIETFAKNIETFAKNRRRQTNV